MTLKHDAAGAEVGIEVARGGVAHEPSTFGSAAERSTLPSARPRRPTQKGTARESPTGSPWLKKRSRAPAGVSSRKLRASEVGAQNGDGPAGQRDARIAGPAGAGQRGDALRAEAQIQAPGRGQASDDPVEVDEHARMLRDVRRDVAGVPGEHDAAVGRERRGRALQATRLHAGGGDAAAAEAAVESAAGAQADDDQLIVFVRWRSELTSPRRAAARRARAVAGGRGRASSAQRSAVPRARSRQCRRRGPASRRGAAAPARWRPLRRARASTTPPPGRATPAESPSQALPTGVGTRGDREGHAPRRDGGRGGRRERNAAEQCGRGDRANAHAPSTNGAREGCGPTSRRRRRPTSSSR